MSAFQRRFSKRETTVRKWTFGQEPKTNESSTKRSSARLDKSSINALSSSSKQTIPEILRGLTLPSGTPEGSENSSDLNYDLEPPSQSTINSTSFQSRPKQKVQLKTKDDTSSSSGVRTRSSDTEQRETGDSSSSSSRVQTTRSGREQRETNDNRLSNTKVQINSNTKQRNINDYRTSSSGVRTRSSDTEQRETGDSSSSSSRVQTTSSDTEQRETNDNRLSNTKVQINSNTKQRNINDYRTSSSGVRTRSSDTEQRETGDSSSSSSRVQTTSSDTEQRETNDNGSSSSEVETSSDTEQRETNDSRSSNSDVNTNKKELSKIIRKNNMAQDESCKRRATPIKSPNIQSVESPRRSSRLDAHLEKDEDHEKRKTSRMNLIIATQIKSPKIQSVESPRRSFRLDSQLENVGKGKNHEKRKSSRRNLSFSMSEAIERDKEGKHQDKGKPSEPLEVNDRRRRSKYDTDTLTDISSDVYIRETDKDVSDDTSSKKNTSQGKTSHRKDLNSRAKITATDENISPRRSRQSQKKNITPQKSMQLPRKNITRQKSRQSPRKNVSPQKSRHSITKNISPQKSRQSTAKNRSPQKSRQSTTRKNISPQKSRQSPNKEFVDTFQTSSSRQHISTAESPVNISHNKVWKTQTMERESDRNDEFVEASCKDSAKNVQIPMTSMDDIEQYVNNRTSSVDDKDRRKRQTEACAIMLPSPPKKHKIGHKSNFVSMVIDKAETDQEHAIDGKDKKYNDIMQNGDIEVDSDINEHGRMQHGDIEVDSDINEHDRMQHGDIEVDSDINEHDRMQHGDIEVDSDINEHDRMQHGDIELDSDINEQIGEKRLLHSSKDNKVINSSKTDEVEGQDDDKSREVQDLSNKTNDDEIEDLDDESREVQDLSNKTMYDEIEDLDDDESREVQDLSNKTMYDEIEDLQTTKTVHAEEVEDEGDDKSSDKNDEVTDLCNDENGEEGEITTFRTIENLQSDNVQDSHDHVDDSVSPDLVLVSGKTPFGKTPVKNVVKKKAKTVSGEKDSVAHGQTIRMLRGQNRRTARDVLDLDIVLDSMTNTIEEKRASCDHSIKKALNRLLIHTRKEFTDMIDCIEDLKSEKKDKTVQRREVKDLKDELYEVQQNKKSVMKKIEVKKDEVRNKLNNINQWLMSMTQLMKTKRNIRSPRKMEYVTYGNFPGDINQ